ncbi:MAG: 16S rRNA (guanine(966)-N(2))-methyltransferase RsmD [Burkholderiaceae bacterium]
MSASASRGRPAGAPRTRSSAAAAPPHRIRIVGGQWKRTPLTVVDGAGLRPTPDRVRETVFNWLVHLLGDDWSSLRCLDLFAGSGALGFEAASRGAADVLMVEQNPAAVRQIEAVKTRLGATQVEVRRGDALTALQRLAGARRFDLVFADPPYGAGWLETILPTCRAILRDGGLLYVESEMPLAGGDAPAWLHEWDIVRAGRAGMVHFHLLRPRAMPASGERAELLQRDS